MDMLIHAALCVAGGAGIGLGLLGVVFLIVRCHRLDR
jgi:hypothetical protein